MSSDIEALYQHFRPEEKPFVEYVLHRLTVARDDYVPGLSDFLNPREQEMICHLKNTVSEVDVKFCGGSASCERKRALFCPPYFQPSFSDFQLTLFEIDYPRSYVSIDHRSLLGSLTGLGLVREKFGDLLLQNGRVQFVCAKEIASYVFSNLTKVGRVSVSLTEVPFSCMLKPEEQWEEKTGSVSALRLDAVVAEIYRLPRSRAGALIDTGRVRVNWKTVESRHMQLKEGDHLSVSGFGRSKLFKIDGRSKKGKWRISYGKKRS